MKNDRCGKAAILSQNDYARIRKEFKSRKYKILWDLAWYTGERWGALLQLQVADVYNADGSVKDEITFRASTRKACPDGSRKTRQVPVHDVLRDVLADYKPDHTVFLFPNRAGDGPIKLRPVDALFRGAVERAGLMSKGISTHSTRRTFITRLYRNGTDVLTIKRITGHKSYQVLEGYIAEDVDRIKGAINSL